ncbi:hypothetical protein B0T16DRAFT_401841 [Cercophora newfieldiana]|uniref:Uncharacterized protein n=1 Tax=Cercophora newfieldiana TaxID=92897 RepID=A0AA39YRZ4_9PEZI|nr:hypothetical protein B0T16DRAFT_401841 [Cercophora newfieldiana]
MRYQNRAVDVGMNGPSGFQSFLISKQTAARLLECELQHSFFGESDESPFRILQTRH